MKAERMSPQHIRLGTRVGVAAITVGCAFFVVFVLTFGAATSCTNKIGNDCSSIGVWAWATITTTTLICGVAVVLATTRGRAAVVAAAAAISLTVGSVVIYSAG